MPIVMLIIFIVGGFLFFLKLRKSKIVDNLTHDIWNEDDQKPNDVIKNISVAEQTLKTTAAQQKKEAEQLQKESTKIGDYLADRGVVKPQKGKEADGS